MLKLKKQMKGVDILKEIFTNINDLPITLSARHVANTLGLSRAGAYNLMNSKGFPTLIIGKRKVVPKDLFITWINKHVKGAD